MDYPKSKLEIDQLGGVPFKGFVPFFRYGYFVENIEPTMLLEQIKAKFVDSAQLSTTEKERLTNLKNSISEDDNNYAFIGKWK